MSISAETHTHQSSNAPVRRSCGRAQLAPRSHSALRDEDLVARAQVGDTTAYGTLYERYQPYIAKILGDDVRDIDARHDISQAVFERGWRKISDLRNPKAFRPWLAQLARRLIIDHYRFSSRTVSTDFTDPNKNYELVSHEWSAHDWAAMRELAANIRSGLDAMSIRDAAVLKLASDDGFNSQEIAIALNIEASHARVVLHRARRRLEVQLGVAA